MRNLIIVVVIIILVGLGFWFLAGRTTETVDLEEKSDSMVSDEFIHEKADQGGSESEKTREAVEVIGQSAGGKDIFAYNYGEGEKEILFVGGIHGGYSWNTSLVAYELIDHLDENSDDLSGDISVTVVPVLNPDGLEKVTGKSGRFSAEDVSSDQDVVVSGRFNDNNVDLNRNFDCDWQQEGTWQSRSVDGGESAMSEPESRAIVDYIEEYGPDAVVVWYSAAGGVFSSNCHEGVLSETKEITNIYADASGYPAYEEFNFYEITGDFVNWLAREKIPAISVLLTSHDVVEWSKNKAGVEALLEYYSE